METAILDILGSLPIPVGVALVLLIAAYWRGSSVHDGSKVRRLASPAAGLIIAAAMLCAYWYSKAGGWSIPPRQSIEWIWAATAAGALGAIILSAVPHAWARVLLRVMLVSVVMVGVSWRKMHTQWSAGESSLWLGSSIAAISLAWVLLDHFVALPRGPASAGLAPVKSETVHAWSSPLALMGWAGLTSQALLSTGGLQIGKFAAILAMVLGAVVVVAVFRPSIDLSGGGVGVVTLLLGLLIFSGYHFSSLDKLGWLGALLVLAPIFAWGVDVLFLRRLGRVPRSIGRVAAISLLPLIVLSVSIPAAIKASQESSEYGY